MTDDDVERVLALNAAHVELLSPMDRSRLEALRRWATRCDVITSGGVVAGFVVVMGPGTTYDSPNYRWFTQRYGDRFDYLDRIVVDDAFRRRGLASAVYDVVEADASSAAGSRSRSTSTHPTRRPWHSTGHAATARWVNWAQPDTP